MRKAGQTGRARAAELKAAVEEIRETGQVRTGRRQFAWVKAHVSIRGNEGVGQLAKEGAALSKQWEGVGVERVVTDGAGAEVAEDEGGGEEGDGDGDGEGDSVERVNYVHCRTGKGKLDTGLVE